MCVCPAQLTHGNSIKKIHFKCICIKGGLQTGGEAKASEYAKTSVIQQISSTLVFPQFIPDQGDSLTRSKYGKKGYF